VPDPKEIKGESNFLEAKTNHTLTYGKKTLKFEGIQEKDNDQLVIFQYSEHGSSGLTQRFGISPRFYQSYEMDNVGDGYYEFKPKTGDIQSVMYSKVDKIQYNEGKFSGKFHIIYDDKVVSNKFPG